MEFQQQIPLKDWTWWRVGGPAENFCLPTNLEEIKQACQWAQERQLAITVLGGGTNVLVSDLGVAGLVICLRQFKSTTVTEINNRLVVEASSGTPKSELVKIFLKQKLPPALFLCGLPGDVGGGVVMNAGVAESVQPREFQEITDWFEVLHPQTLVISRFENAEVEWTYRHSGNWQPGIVVRAGFSWPLVEDPDIGRKVKEASKLRLQRQPLEWPSCGSTFKNPVGHKAGALIEQAGLKGFQIGGAQVSMKHANFIINLGGAKAQEIRQVILHVQSEVLKRFQVQLETEVRLLGNWD